jgi:protein gp37
MTTKIEWVRNADNTQGVTWNPVTGCTPISDGCKNCYARRMARRLAGRYGYPEAPRHFDVTLHPERLEEPLHWRRPRTVFVCSMSDLFHNHVRFRFVSDLLSVIAQTPQHTYQILTKRPRRMKAFIEATEDLQYDRFDDLFPNVWLGVTVENQRCADERREHFKHTPAAVKFVSYEPALGPIDWTGWEFVDQIISGGESGPGARPSHPDWHRATRDFCQENGIAYFFKQWGEWLSSSQWTHADVAMGYYSLKSKRIRLDGDDLYRVGRRAAGRLLDGQLWEEVPR